MKKQEKLLINFFSGNLNDKEKIEFLEHASSDKDFLKSFIKGIELNNAIDDYTGNTEEKVKNTTRKYILQKPLKLTACILAVAAFFILCFYLVSINKNIHVSDGEKIFTKYYSPYNFNLTRGDLIKNSPFEIILNYCNENYKFIYTFDPTQINTNEELDIINLLIGVSCIEMKDFSKAQISFEAIGEKSDIYSTACWYRSLLQIRNENYEKAIELLNIVIANNLIFYESAEKLIPEIQHLGKKP
jgi:hypothetical protein